MRVSVDLTAYYCPLCFLKWHALHQQSRLVGRNASLDGKNTQLSTVGLVAGLWLVTSIIWKNKRVRKRQLYYYGRFFTRMQDILLSFSSDMQQRPVVADENKQQCAKFFSVSSLAKQLSNPSDGEMFAQIRLKLCCVSRCSLISSCEDHGTSTSGVASCHS
jgi:hypothetical protein